MGLSLPISILCRYKPAKVIGDELASSICPVPAEVVCFSRLSADSVYLSSMETIGGTKTSCSGNKKDKIPYKWCRFLHCLWGPGVSDRWDSWEQIQYIGRVLTGCPVEPPRADHWWDEDFLQWKNSRTKFHRAGVSFLLWLLAWCCRQLRLYSQITRMQPNVVW